MDLNEHIKCTGGMHETVVQVKMELLTNCYARPCTLVPAAVRFVLRMTAVMHRNIDAKLENRNATWGSNSRVCDRNQQSPPTLLSEPEIALLRQFVRYNYLY